MVATKPLNRPRRPDPLFQTDLRWCPVNLSEILGSEGKRFEASRYSLEAKAARELIESLGATTIAGEGGLALAFHHKQFRRVFVASSPFPIFQPSQINEIRPKAKSFLSQRTKANLDELRVKAGQLLLTCSGTIGDVTFVGKTLDNQIFSHDLIRIASYDPNDAGYIYAFLKTRTGRALVTGAKYGIIKHIEPEHLEGMPIPIGAPTIRKRIGNLISESFRLRDESNELWSAAELELLGALKLPSISELEEQCKYKKRAPKLFTCKLSQFHDRFEAAFHDPLSDAIIGALPNGSDPLASKVAAILLAGRFKRIYVADTHGMVFIGGKQLTHLDPTNKKYLSLAHHSERIKQQLRISENMILVSCSGTVGKVCLAPKHWEGWAASQHVLRVAVGDPVFAGFLACWLSTDYGQQLIVRNKYGAVIDEINDDHLGSVQIPKVRDAKMRSIGEAILKANALRYRAYLMEHSAITIFNEEVLGLAD